MACAVTAGADKPAAASRPAEAPEPSEYHVSEYEAWLLEWTQEYLDGGGDVDAPIDDRRRTRLNEAAALDYRAVAELLIEHGATVNPPADSQAPTPLQSAARYGSIQVARLLLERGAEPDATTEGSSRKPLRFAVWPVCDDDMVELLLEAGADPNADDGAALRAAAADGTAGKVRLLLAHGAAVDLGERPATVSAIRAGRPEVLKLLLDAGADPEKVGLTPLHLAALNEDLPAVRREIRKCRKAGKSVDIPAESLVTPLYLTGANKDAKVAQALMEAGASVRAADSEHTTPLHWAAGGGSLPVAKLLLAHGADVNAVRYSVCPTPLCDATRECRRDMVKLLLTRGADPNTKLHVFAPLHFASHSGRLDIAQMLIDAGADVDGPLSDFDRRFKRERLSPLSMALIAGRDESLRLLLAAKAQPRSDAWIHACAESPLLHRLLAAGVSPNHRIENRLPTSEDGKRPLHSANSPEERHVARILIARGADVNAKGPDGEPLLLDALQSYRLGTTALLIEHGADTEAVKLTPLHLAVIGGDADAVGKLIDEGAAVDAPAAKRISPLHLAASAGDESILAALLKAGADVDGADARGRTPLHWAVLHGQEAIAGMLLDNGADLNAQDMDGRTPISFVNPFDRSHVRTANVVLRAGLKPSEDQDLGELLRTATGSSCEEATETCRLLLQLGVDPNAADRWGCTPLHGAATWKWPKRVKMLIDAGAEVNRAGKLGETALHETAWGYRGPTAEVCRILLDAGADPNARDYVAKTPLHRAAWSGNREMAALLLEAGANVNARLLWGDTPLHEAAERDDPELIELLLEAGADVNAFSDAGATPVDLAGDMRVRRALQAAGGKPSSELQPPPPVRNPQ